jgi:hypothetical protein
VPADLEGRLRTLAAASAAAVAALLPLSLVAAQPAAVPEYTRLAALLQAHGLSYGLGGYWDGSATTLLSGNQVRVRTVELRDGRVTLYPWETNTGWFDPSRNYANFVVVGTDKNDLSPAAERIFGKPLRTYRVATWEVLVYGKNVLDEVSPVTLPPTS